MIGFFLPESYSIERSAVVNKKQDIVFNYLNSFEHFNDWSPFGKEDPNTKYTFTGPKTGVGHKMAWDSKHSDVGSGSQEIIESKPNSLVKNNLDFGPQGMAYAWFKLAPQGEKTKVTWGFSFDHGNNIISRYFGLMMDGMMIPKYEEGVSNLKIELEKIKEAKVIEAPSKANTGRAAKDGEVEEEEQYD